MIPLLVGGYLGLAVYFGGRWGEETTINDGPSADRMAAQMSGAVWPLALIARRGAADARASHNRERGRRFEDAERAAEEAQRLLVEADRLHTTLAEKVCEAHDA